MFWNWIRTRVREAVLAGLNDAIEYMSGEGSESLSLAITSLDGRLRALPAPVGAESSAPAKGKRKSE